MSYVNEGGSDCDESKCISGTVADIPNPNAIRFDCNKNDKDPLLCADGYNGMFTSYGSETKCVQGRNQRRGLMGEDDCHVADDRIEKVSRLQSPLAIQQDYSCYNLYLVFMAVPDIVLSSFMMNLYVRIYGGDLVDSSTRMERPLNISIILACSTAHTYLNAIVAYEVLALLKHSHRRMHYSPPDAFNVSVKTLVVYLFSTVVGVMRFFDEDKIPRPYQIFMYFVICAGIPMGYVFYACGIIWYHHLIPSTTGKLRVISLYFLRIILVFVLVWFLAIVLCLYG